MIGQGPKMRGETQAEREEAGVSEWGMRVREQREVSGYGTEGWKEG